MADSKGKLLTEINELNLPPRPLSNLNVAISTPVIEVSENHNARITLTAAPGRGYINQVDVLYKRLDLAVILADADVRGEETFTPERVVTLLNGQFGLFFTVADFEVFEPPIVAVGETAELVLTAASTSLGFIGTATISLMHGRPLLTAALPVKRLNVLKHYDPLSSGKRSARMMTWGVDFTSVRDAIKPTPTNRYTDWVTFQAMCNYLGIPGWVAGGIITDHATADIPDSNPDFDRVVIQSSITSLGLIGPVYLHYNTFDEV